jgi:hypothetical protein
MRLHNYLITCFARASTSGGTVSLICLAALRFMMNSNFVACCTGKSAGLAPFKILATGRTSFTSNALTGLAAS